MNGIFPTKKNQPGAQAMKPERSTRISILFSTTATFLCREKMLTIEIKYLTQKKLINNTATQN